MTIRRGAVYGILVAALVAGAVAVLASGQKTYSLRAIFAAALQVVPGEHVEIAGRTVGSISSASLADGQAVVGMNIDASAWPLHAGTIAELRFGSPLGYALRYVQLDPGPARAPALPDGGIIDEADTQTPIELDQLAEIFDPRTRRNLGALLDNADATLRGEAPHLADVLTRGSRGAEQVAGFESDLAENPGALGALITSASAVAGALRQHDPQLDALVSDAADTLQVLERQSTAVQQTLTLAPSALLTGQRTLAHLSRTLPTLQTLVQDVAPGAVGLQSMAGPLATALRTLYAIAPQLTTTLRDGVRDAPVATMFLAHAVTSLPPISSMLGSLGPVLGCLRPYTPELAGALATTVSAYAPYDSSGHYLRTLLLSSPIEAGTTDTPAELTSTYPNLHYAFPRPPGLNVGQPWFQPQCGITHAALDPADDREKP